MKPNYETIYLVPTDYDGGQLTYSWCDCPAPGEGMDPEDAIKYVRADLVPASNAVLANSIDELTRKNSELQALVSEQSKVIEHIDKAVGCEDDPMACWESVDALKAQVEQLKSRLAYFADILESDLLPCLEVDDGCSEDIASARELINKTPAQCLAEIKAQAVEQVFNHFKNKFNVFEKLTVRDICWMLNQHLNQLRQQAKGGE